MLKILAEIKNDNKVISSYVYQTEQDFSISTFENNICEICNFLDIPTPVVVTKHIKNFMLFNYTTFFEDDFVEKIYFEKLRITLFKEK